MQCDRDALVSSGYLDIGQILKNLSACMQIIGSEGYILKLLKRFGASVLRKRSLVARDMR